MKGFHHYKSVQNTVFDLVVGPSSISKTEKWKWAGYLARRNDNRWMLRLTTWRPWLGKRNKC